jgi:hypothetical protein
MTHVLCCLPQPRNNLSSFLDLCTIDKIHKSISQCTITTLAFQTLSKSRNWNLKEGSSRHHVTSYDASPPSKLLCKRSPQLPRFLDSHSYQAINIFHSVIKLTQSQSTTQHNTNAQGTVWMPSQCMPYYFLSVTLLKETLSENCIWLWDFDRVEIKSLGFRHAAGKLVVVIESLAVKLSLSRHQIACFATKSVEQSPDGAEFSLNFLCTGSDWLEVYDSGVTLIPDFCWRYVGLLMKASLGQLWRENDLYFSLVML